MVPRLACAAGLATLRHVLTDEAYAITILHYRKQGAGDTPHKGWFLLGAGLALWTTWQVSKTLDGCSPAKMAA